MTRRIFCFTLAAFLLAAILPFGTLATDEVSENVSHVYYEDGSYLKITITESMSRASGTKTGSKKYEHLDSNGNLCWTATLRGTFTYTGTSATCTASSCDVSISNSAYYVVSKTVGKSGGSATATLTMGRKLLGITISKDTYDLKLTCDKNGNLS